MDRHAVRYARRAGAALAAVLASASPAWAAPPAPDAPRAPVARPAVDPAQAAGDPAAAYAEECGACHVAYPARLLAPAQWFAVLNALDGHYGVDATVDSATLALVARHVGKTAGVPHAAASVPAAASGRRELPRITQQRWFVREHREARPIAGSKLSQCESCHSDAARGSFEERQLLPAARARAHEEENEHERD